MVELTATAREAVKGEKPPKVQTSSLKVACYRLLCPDTEGCGSWEWRAVGSAPAEFHQLLPVPEHTSMSSGACMFAETQMKQACLAQGSLVQILARAVLLMPTKEPATGLAQHPSGRGLRLAPLPFGKGLLCVLTRG